jgi:hypothetical protein
MPISRKRYTWLVRPQRESAVRLPCDYIAVRESLAFHMTCRVTALFCLTWPAFWSEQRSIPLQYLYPYRVHSGQRGQGFHALLNVENELPQDARDIAYATISVDFRKGTSELARFQRLNLAQLFMFGLAFMLPPCMLF